MRLAPDDLITVRRNQRQSISLMIARALYTKIIIAILSSAFAGWFFRLRYML